MAVKKANVTPGTPYTTGAAVTIAPDRDATHVITVAVDASVKVQRRIAGTSVDLDLNTGAALGIDQENTFEYVAIAGQSYEIRFSGACNIQELNIIERRGGL